MGGEKAMSARDVAVNYADAEALRINAAGAYRVQVGDPNKYGIGVHVKSGRWQCAYGVAWSEIDDGGHGVVVDYIHRAISDIERQSHAFRRDMVAGLLKGKPA
jgi:hypothetical protein